MANNVKIHHPRENTVKSVSLLRNKTIQAARFHKFQCV